MHNRKSVDAVMTLVSIEPMKNNPKILAMIGELFYFSGDYERAHTYLRRAHELYPFMKQGLQKYAMLCDMFKKTRELEQLVRPSAAMPYEYSSENWFVMALFLYASLKFDKAQYFINRVILQHQHKNVDALILNAKILHSTKKSNEALASLRQALRHEPARFETHRILVEILMSTSVRDAQNQATKSLKALGDSPRSLTLVASTFLKCPVNKEKAKTLLQKALEINEFYAKAVFFLAQILIDDKEIKAAIKLLEKTSNVVPNIKILLLLADLYAKQKNLSQALEQYTRVLNIDGVNRHALNGLMAMGSTSSANLDKALEVSGGDDSGDIDDEPTVEPSSNDDSELVWSDIDMEIQ